MVEDIRKDEYQQEPLNIMAGYNSESMRNKYASPTNRILIGTPTLGIVRMEWVLARFGQIIPTNWSHGQTMHFLHTNAPMGWLVADAQNIIVKEAVEGEYEWLLLCEDDTCPPPDAFVRINEWMKKMTVPVISGLYYTKGMPPEPLVYRGSGTGYYDDFVLGDQVWCDGIPTGFFLCHMSVLRLMYAESAEYRVKDMVVRRVFEQPEDVWFDVDIGIMRAATGTSDLAWCKRVIREDVLGRSGWKKVARRTYPFLVDTNIFCRHIAPDGRMYPPMTWLPNVRKPPKR